MPGKIVSPLQAMKLGDAATQWVFESHSATECHVNGRQSQLIPRVHGAGHAVSASYRQAASLINEIKVLGSGFNHGVFLENNDQGSYVPHSPGLT